MKLNNTLEFLNKNNDLQGDQNENRLLLYNSIYFYPQESSHNKNKNKWNFNLQHLIEQRLKPARLWWCCRSIQRRGSDRQWTTPARGTEVGQPSSSVSGWWFLVGAPQPSPCFPGPVGKQKTLFIIYIIGMMRLYIFNQLMHKSKYSTKTGDCNTIQHQII